MNYYLNMALAGHFEFCQTMLFRSGETLGLSLILKVIYHLLYSMNKFVTNKSKLPQDGAQVFPYMG